MPLQNFGGNYSKFEENRSRLSAQIPGNWRRAPDSFPFKMATPATVTQLTRLYSNRDEETSTPPGMSSNDLCPTTSRRQLLVLISSFLTICITIGLNQSY